MAAGSAPPTLPPPPRLRWRVGLPVAAALTLIALVLLAEGSRGPTLVGLLVAYLIPPLSKETVLPLALLQGLPPARVAAYFTATDLILAAFVAWNWEALYRLPRAGPWLERQEARVTAATQSWRAAEGLGLLAVALWMAVPFIGSGAATASLLGRALGERPLPVFLAVAAGAVVLNFGYAFFAGALYEVAGALGLVLAVMTFLLVGGLLAYALRYRGGKSQQRTGRR